MARFTYIYRTSEGERREEAMDAASRDGVFAALRERGIRPIKVLAEDGSKANGAIVRQGVGKRVLAGVVVAVLAAGIAVGAFLGRRATLTKENASVAYTTAENTALAELKKNADEVEARFRDALAELTVVQINEPSNVAAQTDVSALYAFARRAQAAIENARAATKDVFASVATSFPPDGEAIRAAQRLYGERMAELDAAEISLSNRKFALALLESNRDKWSLKDGEAAFIDARLARMYKYCLEGIETDGATARWQRDFNAAE